jgi:hypothetical protein
MVFICISTGRTTVRDMSISGQAERPVLVEWWMPLDGAGEL